MVSENTVQLFKNNFKKEDTITVSVIMEKLKISRPTATDLIYALMEEEKIYPLIDNIPLREKWYIVIS